MTSFQFFMVMHGIFFCSGVVGKNTFFSFVGVTYLIVAVLCLVAGV